MQVLITTNASERKTTPCQRHDADYDHLSNIGNIVRPSQARRIQPET
jgi:hypothetical protein